MNQSGQSAKQKNVNESEYKDQEPSIFDQHFNTEHSVLGSQDEVLINRRNKQRNINLNNGSTGRK